MEPLLWVVEAGPTGVLPGSPLGAAQPKQLKTNLCRFCLPDTSRNFRFFHSFHNRKTSFCRPGLGKSAAAAQGSFAANAATAL